MASAAPTPRASRASARVSRRDVALTRNYRSSGTIVPASAQMLGHEPSRAIVRAMHERITIHAAPTERAEAEFVVQTIEG
jgi:DNA helicase-2/ATP-dependent DNA helicase PcrA